MTKVIDEPRDSPSLRRDHPIRIGAVSYLNTLPLIEGLGKLDDVSLTLTAPAQLIDLLLACEIDVGLISLIDAQRSPEPLAMMPAGIIGSGGATMTVRLFSKTPIDSLLRVHVDADSHTSVALLRIILKETFGISPELVEYDIGSHWSKAKARGNGEMHDQPDALLVIGDKIVTNSPCSTHYPHQLDLGQSWNEMTDLPFVYAVWMCKAKDVRSAGISSAAAILDRQRRRNTMRKEWITQTRAPQRGWPVELAQTYLGDLLQFDLDESHRQAIERFFDMCHAQGISDSRRPTLWV